MTWMFEGIGAVIVGALLTVVLTIAFTRATKSRAQRQEQNVVGTNSTAIQAGRDVLLGPTQQDREHDVQPIMHLRLSTGEVGPDGHYLIGQLRNVGRGIARNPKLQAPFIPELKIDRLLKPMEPPFKLRMRYDNIPACLHPLDDPTIRVEFENEFGTKFEQFGEVEQSKGRNEVYEYSINGLGPVQRCESVQ